MEVVIRGEDSGQGAMVVGIETEMVDVKMRV